MQVGVIADTHDNLPRIDKAVKTLNEEKVEMVLHAGDYIAPFVIPKLGKLDAKVIGVLGNNDGDSQLLKEKMEDHGRMEMRGNFTQISVSDLKIALLHGSEEELLEVLINSERFDVVVYGHTHEAEVTREGRTLVINPGEACGYLSGRSTIALFDLEKKKAEIVEL